MFRIYTFDFCVLKRYPFYTKKEWDTLEEAKEFLTKYHEKRKNNKYFNFKDGGQYVFCKRMPNNHWEIDEVIKVE